MARQERSMASSFAAAFLAVAIYGTIVGAKEPLHERIDRLIEAQPGFPRAAPPASDDEFLRRVTLDVTGIIPSAPKARRFLADSSPQKRHELVDRLLESPEYPRHMQRVFDRLLMQRRRHRGVSPVEWREYLIDSFRTNKPWDQLTREILGADGTEEKIRAAAKFYLDRQVNVTALVRDVGTIFLGRDLHCAQCHDHPVIEEWEQTDFYSLAAFLTRSVLFTDKKTQQTLVGERADGEATFTSALTQITGEAPPRLFDGELLTEPKLKKGEEYIVAPDDGARPVPKFSRRAELTPRIIAHSGFARNIVNRLWAQLMGRGLVHPVDQHNDENPASHSELLDLLASEFVASGYDLKVVLRELLSTRTYARTSRLSAAPEGVEPDHFAVAKLRPLSPDQQAWSLARAVGRFDQEQLALVAELTHADPELLAVMESSPQTREEVLHDRLIAEVDSVANIFVTSLPGQAERSEATPDQSLFMMNGELVGKWLVRKPGNLVDRLAKLDNVDALSDELYLSILSRYPAKEEREWIGEHLKSYDDVAPACADLVWALLTSTEFRFNY